jgi:hypothetical protein
MEKVKKYKAYYGLGGGFGGAKDYEIVEANNREDAVDVAYELACETYSSHEGIHGLEDWQDVLKRLNKEEYEDEPLDGDNEDHAKIVDEAYNESREIWLDYWVEECEENEE